MNDSTLTSIPKKLFQTFETKELPAGMYHSTLTWQVKNPTYEYKLFDANDRIAFIQSNFPKEYLLAYSELVPGAFKADFFRLCLLYIEGGVYVDADMICETPLDEFFQKLDTSISFLISRDDPMAKKWLANGFMAASPKHPFVKASLDRALKNIQSKEEMFYLDYTGPGCIGKSVNQVLGRSIEEDYELGLQTINGYTFCLLKHDYGRLKMSYGDLDVVTTEYPTYRQEMKGIGNPPFFDYVQKNRVYSKIPKKIIYTSLDETDLNQYMIDSFQKHNPEYELLYFNQTAVDQWFANSIYNNAYQKLTERGERTDFFRYCYLWENGGFYTDADTFCNQPIRNWLTYQDLAVGYECNHDLPFDFFKEVGTPFNGKMISIANWTIATKPFHPIFSKVINDIIDNPKTGVLQNTGPGRFTKHVLEFFGEETEKGDSVLLPINAFGSNQSHSNAFKSAKPFEVTRPDVYITHMFAGTWRQTSQIKNIKLLQREPHPAVSHNLSLWKTESGFSGISRYDFNQERTRFMEHIGDVRELKQYTFNNSLEVKDVRIKKINNYSDVAKFEDFRQFTYKGKTYFSVAYIDEGFNTRMGILDSDYNFLGNASTDVYNRMQFGIGPEVYFEKNWLFFEKDNELYYIYSTTPSLIIYKCTDFEELKFEKVLEQPTQLSNPIPSSEFYFSKVTTGGSASPIKIGDKYVYLIHTKLYNERKYNHWAVTLDSNLNFVGIHPTPFITKYVGFSLFFINSWVDHDDYVVLSGGVEDNQNFIWEIPKSKLLNYIR